MVEGNSMGTEKLPWIPFLTPLYCLGVGGVPEKGQARGLH